MAAQSLRVLWRGDFINRLVALILGIISIGFIAHMNKNWHETAFKGPFALVIVSTIFILVGAGTSFNIWRVNAGWCPKRAGSLVFLGLAAAGCSAACAALVSQVELGWDPTIQSAVIGTQASAAALEFVSAVFVGAQFFGFGRQRQEHAMPTKEQRVSGESV